VSMTPARSRSATFLSSCGDEPTVMIQAIRRHWTIENGLHWVLDVTFREDDSRVRDRIAARNLAILRKIAIKYPMRNNHFKLIP
jgi:predicted transposase YbfD/YdcC